MPTYEYKCHECGFSFDEFQSIVSEPISICPKCKGHVERVINGGIGLIFKGSGFYLTDYKNSHTSKSDSTQQKPKADAEKARASESVSESKTD